MLETAAVDEDFSAYDQRFQIIGRVGVGGQAEILRAFDTFLSTTVALKMLDDWVCSDDRMLDRVRAEVRAGRKIRHPHVLRIYDLICVGQRVCLVMDFVEGVSLPEALRTMQLPLPRLIRQLCTGLAAIHSAGFAHRDLRPQNLLVDQHGNLTIVDLGFVDVLRDPGPTHPHIAPELQLPSYMLSDIYSLGTLLALISESTKGSEGGISNWLKPIINKCLASDPAHRYPTALEVLNDFDAVSQITALPSSSRLRGWTRRGRWIRWAGMVSGFLLLLGIPSIVPRTPDFTKFVVRSTEDDPRLRTLSDLIAVYLETNKLPVSRVNSVDDHAVSIVHLPVTPSVISLSLDKTPAGLFVRTAFSGRGGARNVLTPASPTVISEVVKSVREKYGLGGDPTSFKLRDGTDEFSRFANSWTAASGPEFSRQEWKEKSSIPVLLLAAKSGVRQYSTTPSQETWEQADQALRALKSQGVDTTLTILLRAALLRHQRNNTDAVRLLQQSLHKLATTAPIYKTLSDLELADGFGNEALQYAANAVERDPLGTAQLISMARAQIYLGHDQDAIRSLSRAISLEPRNTLAQTTLGNLYILLGNFEQGSQYLEKALEIRPSGDGYVYFGLAQILNGKQQEGLLLLNGAAATSPSLYSLGVLGAALRWTGDHRRAEQVLIQAAKFGHENSNDPIELGRLAMVQAQLSNIRKADELIHRAAAYATSGSIEIIYDGMVVDAFARRQAQCAEKFALLEERRFPTAFALRDPQISSMLNTVPSIHTTSNTSY